MKSHEHASHVLFFIRVLKIFTYNIILAGWEPVNGYVLDAFLHDASPCNDLSSLWFI